MAKIETISEYREWIERLKAVPIDSAILPELRLVFGFSPERFAAINGLDTGFVREFQRDRKEVHRRILDYEAAERLKRRKVSAGEFRYSGRVYRTEVCVCTELFANSAQRRSQDRYRFYPGVKYVFARHADFGNFVFDENGRMVCTTASEFNRHFSDCRDTLLASILGD